MVPGDENDCDIKAMIRRRSDMTIDDFSQSEHSLNLRREYESAVECVVQCETIINILQEQLTSKDDKIASLKDMIVEMSLELASLKTLKDEHQLLKWRISLEGHQPSSSDESCRRPPATKDEQEEAIQFLKMNDAPVRNACKEDRRYPSPLSMQNSTPSSSSPRLCPQTVPVEDEEERCSAISSENSAMECMSLVSGDEPEAPIQGLPDLGYFLGFKNSRSKSSKAAYEVLRNSNEEYQQHNDHEGKQQSWSGKKMKRRSSCSVGTRNSGSIISILFEDIMVGLIEETG